MIFTNIEIKEEVGYKVLQVFPGQKEQPQWMLSPFNAYKSETLPVFEAHIIESQ